MLLLLQSKPSTDILSVYLSIGVLATSHKNYTHRMLVNIFTKDISLDKECPILEVTQIQIPISGPRIRTGSALAEVCALQVLSLNN